MDTTVEPERPRTDSPGMNPEVAGFSTGPQAAGSVRCSGSKCMTKPGDSGGGKEPQLKADARSDEGTEIG